MLEKRMDPLAEVAEQEKSETAPQSGTLVMTKQEEEEEPECRNAGKEGSD
jgi:hypothetical protein